MIFWTKRSDVPNSTLLSVFLKNEDRLLSCFSKVILKKSVLRSRSPASSGIPAANAFPEPVPAAKRTVVQVQGYDALQGEE